MPATLYSPEDYAERLAGIQAHLRAGKYVRTVTYARATLYGPKHLHWFSADATGLYVRAGRGKVCLNFTSVQFSQ